MIEDDTDPYYRRQPIYLGGNLFNYPSGVIKDIRTTQELSTPLKIINKGQLDSFYITNQLELDSKSSNNFPLKGQELILDSDREFFEKVELNKISGKNGKELNLKFHKDFNLNNFAGHDIILDFAIPQAVRISNNKNNFKKLINLKDSNA